MTHTVPQTSRIPTGRRVLRILTGALAFLFSLTLFTGCGGEKKGQKEYEEGMNFYTVQQYESAVKQFAAAANLGHAEAQNQLGFCFVEGLGVKPDSAEAVKWWRKAAEQGNASAQFNLGVRYYIGDGVKQDKSEAAKWWRKASEQGNANAQFNLGVCYDNGIGVKKDLKEAAKWYRKAAELGNADAQFNLGLCYYQGAGVDENAKEASKWIQKAADQGHAEAKKMIKKGDEIQENINYIGSQQWLDDVLNGKFNE